MRENLNEREKEISYTKTALHMLKNRGSIWTDSHCRCLARSSQSAYRYLTSGKLG